VGRKGEAHRADYCARFLAPANSPTSGLGQKAKFRADQRTSALAAKADIPRFMGTRPSKTGLAREKIEAIMAAETWLTASEAVELGFADKVEKPVKIAAHFDLQARYGKAPSDQRAAQERQRAANITAACSIAKHPDKARKFIAEGRSVREVLAILIEHKAATTGSAASQSPPCRC
jgi:Clp protease